MVNLEELKRTNKWFIIGILFSWLLALFWAVVSFSLPCPVLLGLNYSVWYLWWSDLFWVTSWNAFNEIISQNSFFISSLTFLSKSKTRYIFCPKSSVILCKWQKYVQWGKMPWLFISWTALIQSQEVYTTKYTKSLYV